MNVLAVIPVRAGDPEAADAGERMLGGKPILGYTVTAALESERVARTVVSTDSPAVAETARRLGAEAPFLRPAELAAPGVPLTRVLQHALLWMEEHEGFRAEVVVLLEITHPLRPAGLVDQVVEALTAENLEAVFAAREERHEFWVVQPDGGLERLQPREELSRDALPPLFKEMGGMAHALRAELIRAGHRLGERVGLVPVRDASSLVDLREPDGLRLAEALLRTGSPAWR